MADRSRKIFGLPPEPMKKWVASYGLAQNDSSLSKEKGMMGIYLDPAEAEAEEVKKEGRARLVSKKGYHPTFGYYYLSK